jgi:hypothetical protein
LASSLQSKHSFKPTHHNTNTTQPTLFSLHLHLHII